MSHRTSSLISVILNLLLLVIFAVLTFIFEIIVLNGASESQGTTAFGISLICLGIWAVLLGVFSWKATALLIAKFDMNPALAILLTLILGMLLSGAISVLAIISSIPLAGIR